MLFHFTIPKRLSPILILMCLGAVMLTGCRAYQPVVWKYNAPMDEHRGGKVHVVAKCEMPKESVDQIQARVQEEVDKVLESSSHSSNNYLIGIDITRYDRGFTPLRVITFGLFGRIYLDGEVSVSEGSPSEIIGFGTFHKMYGPILPLASIFASMEGSVIPKVGKSVAKAIKQSTEK